MKILIVNSQGEGVFSFDAAAKTGQVMQAVHSGTADIRAALESASQFMASDHHVIASIRADISAAIGRIEHELGANPAFTWAQTKLGHAAAHLEAYVAGNWTEPPVISGVVMDQRGVVVAANPPPPAGMDN